MMSQGTRLQHTINSNHIQRILIRSANWVGDAVMTIPVLTAIRRQFPKAQITLLAKSWVAPLFEGYAALDEILIYDAGGRHAGLSGLLQLSRELRCRRFDLALLLQNAFEAAWITLLAGIPYRLGYATDGRALLLTHPVKRPANYEELHQIDYYRGLLQSFGWPSGRDMQLAVSLPERVRAFERLRQRGYQSTHRRIGLNPGAAFGSAKRWPLDYFAALGQRLARDEATCFIIFGGPGEAALGETLAAALPQACINLCGQTSLREAMALLSTCQLLITNDSGLMHIATALKIPLAAVFGPTDHQRTSPAGPASVIIRKDTPCSPCLKPECPLQHHRCMRELLPEMVYAQMHKIIH